MIVKKIEVVRGLSTTLKFKAIGKPKSSYTLNGTSFLKDK
jgi:hypothetical protein